MISQLLCALIDGDPLYVAKRTADTRRYIMTAWRKSHDDLLDENAVALFLCDPLCGSLTPEQIVFASRCRDEMNSVYGETLFRLVQCWVMVRRGMVKSLRDGLNLLGTGSPNEPPCSPCEPLCGFAGTRVGKDSGLGGLEGFRTTFRCAESGSRRKALALFSADAGHGSPQCGLPRGFAGFWKWR